MNKVQILDPKGINARLKRMAYEIWEINFLEPEFLLIGIDERGGFIARLLQKQLELISGKDVQLLEVELDRSEESPLFGIHLDLEDPSILQGKSLVVVDDVLYTGTTLMNVVSILLQTSPSKIRTAVLIDRGHRNMPVAADIVGMELATTLHQHVSVEFDPEGESAYAFLG